MNDVALATGAVVSTTSIPEVYSSWIDALIVVGTSAAVWRRYGRRALGFAVCALDRNRQCQRLGRHC